MTNQFIYKGLLISTLAGIHVCQAQVPSAFRIEAEAGVSVLRLPVPYRTGGLYHQQVTGYVSPRLGIALGVNWGSSANPDPLQTRYVQPTGGSAGAPVLPDPVALRSFYQRSDQMTDLALVYRPLLSRRHQVRMQVGLSVYRRREVGVDSVRFVDPQQSYYETIGTFTDTRRIVPTAAVSYDWRLSSRWAIGLTGTAYLTAGIPVTSLGLHGAYRFNVGADSLGIRSLPADNLHAGIRVGTVVTDGADGASPGRVYRARFVGGLWAELPLSLTWAIRGEVNYAQRGYRTSAVQTSGGTYLSSFGNLNYLDVPLLFRHEVAYRWHLYGGPYLAFFLNGYTESAGMRNAVVQPHATSGLALGTSYALTKRLAIDIRYQRDLIALTTTSYGAFQTFQAGVNWQLSRRP